MKTSTLIIIGIFFLLPLAVISYLTLLPDMNDKELPPYTGNPNECWYEDESGTMLPCEIETGESAFFIIFLIMASPFFIIGTIVLIVIWYSEKKKRQERNEN